MKRLLRALVALVAVGTLSVGISLAGPAGAQDDAVTRDDNVSSDLIGTSFREPICSNIFAVDRIGDFKHGVPASGIFDFLPGSNSIELTLDAPGLDGLFIAETLSPVSGFSFGPFAKLASGDVQMIQIGERVIGWLMFGPAQGLLIQADLCVL